MAALAGWQDGRVRDAAAYVICGETVSARELSLFSANDSPPDRHSLIQLYVGVNFSCTHTVYCKLEAGSLFSVCVPAACGPWGVSNTRY